MAGEGERSRVLADEQVNDDALNFDLKKKKKKKKKVLDDDIEAMATPDQPDSQAEQGGDDGEGGADLDFSKKKKKKKKPAAVEGEAETEEADAEKTTDGTKDGDDDVLDLKKKKKKKSKKVKIVEEDVDEQLEEEFNDLNLDDPLKEGEKKKKKKKKVVKDTPVSEVSGGVLPWAGSDRDYTYGELLQRVTDILKEKNPELSGEKKKFLMKPPHVVREGTKKTVFLNFAEICKIMKRNQEHVYQFMLAELGTSGSIDGSQRMVIKGKFQPKAIENILRRYVVEYLTCHSCKSRDTNLSKDNRLFFLICNQCGAQRSVAAIKTGYIAQVGKRKK